MMTPLVRRQTAETRLIEALSPTFLEIVDESHAHLGHVGARSGGSHFSITINAPSFQNQSDIHCHRQVYAALGDLMKEEIHALKILIYRG